MKVKIYSFGFKYNDMPKANLVLDCRDLPNPYYVEGLKDKSGLDEEVRDYIFSHESAQKVFSQMLDLVKTLVKLAEDNDKEEFSIAFGCTGGQHRSVSFAEVMSVCLMQLSYGVEVHHLEEATFCVK